MDMGLSCFHGRRGEAVEVSTSLESHPSHQCRFGHAANSLSEFNRSLVNELNV